MWIYKQLTIESRFFIFALQYQLMINNIRIILND